MLGTGFEQYEELFFTPEITIEFEEIDLAIQPEKWHELEKLTGGDRITPVCVEGDSITVGFHGVG